MVKMAAKLINCTKEEQRSVIRILIIYNNNNNNNLFTAIGLLPGGSGYFTCKQNMKLVTTKLRLACSLTQLSQYRCIY